MKNCIERRKKILSFLYHRRANGSADVSGAELQERFGPDPITFPIEILLELHLIERENFKIKITAQGVLAAEQAYLEAA